jgi:hypothetical protein
MIYTLCILGRDGYVLEFSVFPLVATDIRCALLIVQNVRGGEINFLGGHRTGHSKQKKVYMYKCPIPNGFRD